MWSAQLRLLVLLAILPATVPVLCTHCRHAAAPHARFCGRCGEMLNQVNLLTTFTLLGTSAFLARSAAKNSTPTSTAKRQATLTPAGPSAKKKQAQNRPQCPVCHRTFGNTAGLGNHMNTHKLRQVGIKQADSKRASSAADKVGR